MRILLLADQWGGDGGVSVYLDTLQEQFKRRGHEVKMITFSSRFFFTKKFANYKLFVFLRGIIKSFNPEIIHIHDTFSFQNTIYLSCLGYKTFITIHNYTSLLNLKGLYLVDGIGKDVEIFYTNNKSHNYLMYLERIILNSSNLLSVNKDLGNRILQKGIRSKILEYPSLLKRKNCLSYQKKKFTILYVGRLFSDKGVRVLLDAFRLLVKDVDCQLLIVGDGPDKFFLEGLYVDAGVDFLGHVERDQLCRVYSRSDILVVPSVGLEVSPLVMYEAINFGLPIIGSNILGIREFIKENKVGFTFTRGSSDDLFSKLNRVIKTPVLFNKFSRNALKSSKKYDLTSHVENLLNLYNTSCYD